METVMDHEGAESSPTCKDDVETEEFCALLQQQKNLNNLTEHALKKNRPIIKSNLMHEHDSEMGHNFSSTLKLEQMCLQSLSMVVISCQRFVLTTVLELKFRILI